MDQTYTQSNPKIVYRSKLFSLIATNLFSCNSSYSMTSRWKLNRIDSSSTQIDLSSNPSWQSSELAIQANSLSYGVYVFNFETNVTLSSNNTLLTNNLSTYVQIIPTGLAIYGLPNGVSGLLVGSLQSFSLKPALYSVDMDNLISPNSLIFKFYCSTIEANSVLSSNNNNVNMDLLTYKNNSLLQMTWNATCFSSNGML